MGKYIKGHPQLADYIRALRLPFISVSVLAFTLGSLIDRSNFNILSFFLGLSAAIFTHLGANLINDYADSKSGVDWLDKKSYNFFGGSKLIQESLLSEGFYYKSSLFCFGVAFFSVLFLALRLKLLLPLCLYPPIVFLGWAYSERPLELAYRRLGELVIFILFGPTLVMGGYFIQTLIFPDLKSFLLSLPLGILTTLILFVNEVPDYHEDMKARKINWVSFLGPQKAYIIYLFLFLLAIASVVINIVFGSLGIFSLLSLIALLPAAKAAGILKSFPKNKEEYILSSKLTILVHTLVSIILIIDILI